MDADPELEGSATGRFALARAGGTDASRASVEAGVPANLTHGEGDTLLMLAACHGHAEPVGMPVGMPAGHGTECDRPGDRGQAPLAGAMSEKESAVVRALLDAGPDPGAGAPSAVDAARMFASTQYLQWFGAK